VTSLRELGTSSRYAAKHPTGMQDPTIDLDDPTISASLQ
jgi:hypothetical protein